MTIERTHPIMSPRGKLTGRSVCPAQKDPLFAGYLSVRSVQVQRKQIRAFESAKFSVLQTTAGLPRLQVGRPVKAYLAWFRKTHHPALTGLVPTNVGITKHLVRQ